MKYLPFCLSLFLLMIFQPSHAQRPTGLKFNDKVYSTTERLSPALKWSEDNLPVYSLRKYCPIPGDQGNIGSCVGWSTGYGALTIAQAIQSKNTDPNSITSSARSALYIYLQIVEQCPDGSVISDALDLVKLKGDCYAKDFGPKPCGTEVPPSLDDMASEFKIKDYYTLFELNASADQKINATRSSIIANKPVVVGLKVTNSIFNVGATGLWDPTSSEPTVGGHAVCVVGYDDQKEVFEIMNSWGPTWGDKGFFTISYEDYGQLCKYGYQFTLDGGSTKEVSLTGNFKFRKYNNGIFEDAPVKLQGTEYTIDNVFVNDFFRIAASNIIADKYVYIFSIKPDNSAELLFPTTKVIDAVTIKDIPVVPSNNVVLEIPENPKKGLTTDMAGNDVLCILYSAEEIEDIDEVVSQVKNGSGSFTYRLRYALGDRLIPSANIKYSSNEMGLTAKSDKGTVAPIVLKVNVKQ